MGKVAGHRWTTDELPDPPLSCYNRNFDATYWCFARFEVKVAKRADIRNDSPSGSLIQESPFNPYKYFFVSSKRWLRKRSLILFLLQNLYKTFRMKFSNSLTKLLVACFMTFKMVHNLLKYSFKTAKKQRWKSN